MHTSTDKQRKEKVNTDTLREDIFNWKLPSYFAPYKDILLNAQAEKSAYFSLNLFYGFETLQSLMPLPEKVNHLRRQHFAFLEHYISQEVLKKELHWKPLMKHSSEKTKINKIFEVLFWSTTGLIFWCASIKLTSEQFLQKEISRNCLIWNGGHNKINRKLIP